MDEWFWLSRIFLGGIFLMSGMGKIASPSTFAHNVQNYEVLPRSLGKVYGYTVRGWSWRSL